MIARRLVSVATLLGSLSIGTSALAQDPCTLCGQVLEKQDLSQTARSSSRKLDYLRILDQSTYKRVSDDVKAGGTVPVEGVPIDFTASYSHFVDERTHLFDQVGYHLTDDEAYANLEVRTNPIAFKAWSKCMERCVAQPSFRARIAKEDEKGFIVEAVYLPGAHDRDPIQLAVDVTNGTAYELGHHGAHLPVKGTIRRSDDKRTIFVSRTDRNARTTIVVVAEGSSVWTIGSAYPPKWQPGNAIDSTVHIYGREVHGTNNDGLQMSDGFAFVAKRPGYVRVTLDGDCDLLCDGSPNNISSVSIALSNAFANPGGPGAAGGLRQVSQHTCGSTVRLQPISKYTDIYKIDEVGPQRLILWTQYGGQNKLSHTLRYNVTIEHVPPPPGH